MLFIRLNHCFSTSNFRHQMSATLIEIANFERTRGRYIRPSYYKNEKAEAVIRLTKCIGSYARGFVFPILWENEGI